MEHHSNLVPWQMACQFAGATLKILPFNDDGSLQGELLTSLLSHKTRLLAVSHVSNVLGTINPAKQMIRTAHEHDVPVLVDAAQSVPHTRIDVRDLDCDFLAFSGHKLYAETGIGVLYGKKKWLDAVQPSQFGGGMVSSVTLDETTCGDLPYKFEAGTPNIAGAISLAAAIDYLDEIGMEAIADHERAVMAYASEQLSELDGLSIYGTVDKCGALSFNLDTVNPYDAATLLDKMGIAVRSGTHCAEPVMQHYRITGALRASFGVYNTTEEVDALIHGIRKVQALLS
jgi:cysteine desulfurase/selenocysteine lyase